MYIQTSEYLKAPREIHADSLGTLVAQLSLADIAVLLESKQQQLMVFLGMRENVCLTSEVESVSVNHQPTSSSWFQETRKKTHQMTRRDCSDTYSVIKGEDYE